MTKAELIDVVAEKTGLTKKAAASAVDATFNAIKEALAKGENFTLIGFGTFSVVERAERQGVNPQNPSEKITIPARKSVKFKAGKQLKDMVK